MRRRKNGKFREPQPGVSRAVATDGQGSPAPAMVAGNDLTNLPASGNVAAIFLDRKLCVRRFTPAVTRFLSVIDSDIGRPMSEIVRRFRDDALLDDARRVLSDMVPASAEVRADLGGWHLRRILPYRTRDEGIEGVVITFADATDSQALMEALRVSEAQARWLGRFPGENPNPVLRVSADGTVLYRNPAAEASPAWRSSLPQEDLRRLIDKAITDGKPAEVELELGGTPYTVSISPVLAESCVNVYVRDITERKQTEQQVEADLAALTRMHALSGRVVEAASIEPLLQETMDTAVAITQADKGTLRLFEGDTLRIVAHHGHDRPFLDHFAAAENVASVCGEATRRGERIVVPDVETSPMFAGTSSLPVLRAAGVRAVQSTPLLTRAGRLLGILTTQWAAPHTPDEHNLWRLDLLARQAADLIEQKQAEEALRESEEKLRSSFANAAIGFAITTPDGRYVDANPAYCRLTGYDLAELTATAFPQLIHPEDQADNMELIRRMLAGELPGFVVENRYVRKGGATVDVRKSVAVVRASNGAPRWIIALVEDITERKQAEEALRQSEERFRLMFEGHGAPMLLIEPDSGQIIDANEAAARFYEYSRQQLRAMHIDQINQLPAEEVAADRRKAVELGKNLFVFPHRLAGGDVRWVEVYSSPVAIQGVPMLFSIVHDITARRQAEEALTQRTAQLARSNEDLQQFAYASSHDLQEPLRMVSGFLKLLEDRYGPLLDDKARQYIGFAVEGATRMSQLIRDLLEFSRVERQGGPMEPTDPNQALNEALANLRSAAQEAGASIASDELPIVLADRSQLMLLFQNLVSNAVKFRSADRPCRVHVGVRKADDKWEFSVRDNGIGIPADSFDRIFALFQRLHTREEYAGTGIGLAICKKIVERHGGRIWVESRLGEGASFLLTLPVVEP